MLPTACPVLRTRAPCCVRVPRVAYGVARVAYGVARVARVAYHVARVAYRVARVGPLGRSGEIFYGRKYARGYPSDPNSKSSLHGDV